MNKTRRILRLFLLFLCLGSLLGAGLLLCGHIREELVQQDLDKETKEDYVTIPDGLIPEVSASDGYIYDWNAMQAVNEDVVGWIRFDNPDQIDYPIVQGSSNQTYLTHNWKGGYSSYGSIFMNTSNAPDFTDANTLLYGHRMISGAMFGSLKKYKTHTFMEENPYFYIYTPDGKKRTYEIYAYAQVTDAGRAYTIRFDTLKERQEYQDWIRNKASVYRDITVGEYDSLVTLSTCASSGYYNRIIVQGKLIAITQNQ